MHRAAERGLESQFASGSKRGSWLKILIFWLQEILWNAFKANLNGVIEKIFYSQGASFRSFDPRPRKAIGGPASAPETIKIAEFKIQGLPRIGLWARASFSMQRVRVRGKGNSPLAPSVAVLGLPMPSTVRCPFQLKLRSGFHEWRWKTGLVEDLKE